MTSLKYILKSLKFYKRQHVAVFLATVISTAVLTGALIVGDSVKLSLNHLVDLRLGKVSYALHSGDRFVQNELGENIGQDLDVATSSLLQINGIAINQDNDSRQNNIQVYGIDSDFYSLSEINYPILKKNEVIINNDLAQKLNLSVNDQVLLKIEKSSIIPLNAPFADQSESSISMRLTVKEVADDGHLGRFSLKSNQASPFNVFVNKEALEAKMELKGLANLILVKDSESLSQDELNSSIGSNWNIKDAGLEIRDIDQDHFEIVSNRIFIDQPIGEILKKNSSDAILTYLVNSISSNQHTTPYSFVTASSKYDSVLKNNDDIVINQWLADDLQLNINDSITLEYFVIGALRKLELQKATFNVKAIIPTSKEKHDLMLMPDFPGLADAGSCSDWETGIPVDLEKIRDKDEKYWDEYKGSPKAFISIEKGEELWQNQFGNYTSFRFDKNDISIEEIQKVILSELSPQDLNLRFDNYRNKGQTAAFNGVDFGQLFLSLSFFVIAAGILLTVLIYSLNTQSRAKESGVLAGLGFSKKKIITLRILESSIIIIVGGFVGMALGILYNYALMFGLNGVWQGAVRTQMLDVYLLPNTLLIGAFSGIFISIISIIWVSYSILKNPSSALINDENLNTSSKTSKKKITSLIVAFVCLAISIGLASYGFINSIDQNASLFLSAGALMIIALISGLSYFTKHTKTRQQQNLSIYRLSLSNAFKNRSRSFTSIALLALGTFSIIITGSNRKTFIGTDSDRHSGTGGFTWWAETSIPILNDLNTSFGKEAYGLDGEEALSNTRFIQFQSRDGDDASCLNLNQVSQPRIFGMNINQMEDLNPFSFAKLSDQVNPNNPWNALDTDLGENIIPTFADQTVITWGLIKKIGDTLYYHDEFGKEIKLLLMGGLKPSVLQGQVFISEKYFSKHFPSVSGSRVMLIEAGQDQQKAVQELLENDLEDYGITLQSTTERLAEFYSVTNTYLSVFMFLGGLGLIIGTIGMGIVILRNMLDRKHEFALLQAIGFKKKQVFKLVLLENTLILLIGVTIGITGAIMGMLPSLLSPSFEVPLTFVFMLILLILLSGMLWIILATQSALNKDLMPGLRNE